MAFLEYNLYLIQKLEDKRIIPSIEDKDVMDIQSDMEAVAIFNRVPCVYRESANRMDPDFPINILTIAFETKPFERLLENEASDFFSWFWRLTSLIPLRFAFIGDGSYAEYYRTAGITNFEVFSRLGRSLDAGKLEVIHPLMYFPPDFANDQLRQKIRSAPYYTVVERRELGYILALIEGDLSNNRIEIIDPGKRYWDIFQYFRDL